MPRPTSARTALFQLYRFELRGRNDFKQLAVVGIIQHGMLDARGLQPGGPLPHRDLPFPFEFRFDPSPENVDHLYIHVVEVALRYHRRIARRGETDHVCLQEPVGSLAHAEVTVSRIAAQAIRAKVLRPEM